MELATNLSAMAIGGALAPLFAIGGAFAFLAAFVVMANAWRDK